MALKDENCSRFRGHRSRSALVSGLWLDGLLRLRPCELGDGLEVIDLAKRILRVRSAKRNQKGYAGGKDSRIVMGLDPVGAPGLSQKLLMMLKTGQLLPSCCYTDTDNAQIFSQKCRQSPVWN